MAEHTVNSIDDIDGKWFWSTHDEDIGWPETVFDTKEEAIADAAAHDPDDDYDVPVVVGRGCVVRAEQIIEAIDIERMLEHAEEGTYLRECFDKPVLKPTQKTVEAIRAAVCRILTETKSLRAVFTFENAVDLREGAKP